jgi:hypothetical protein
MFHTHRSSQRHKKMWLPLSEKKAILSLWPCCISQELCSCWWKELTCIVAVHILGLVGWRNIILVSGVIQCLVCFLFWLLLYTIHDIQEHRNTHCSSVEQFHVPFYSDILWNFLQTKQDYWRAFILVQKHGALWQQQQTALCWAMVHTWPEMATSWDVLCSAHGVSPRHCITMKWECVYVCVCHMMFSGQPAQQQVVVYANCQFLQPLYSCFVFSKSLTHMVNLFWLPV